MANLTSSIVNEALRGSSGFNEEQRKALDTVLSAILNDMATLDTTSSQTTELYTTNNLQDLVVADLTGATNGQQLTYNSSNTNWEPGTA